MSEWFCVSLIRDIYFLEQFIRFIRTINIFNLNFAFFQFYSVIWSMFYIVKAQQQQEFEGGRIQENRRRGSVDEDADEYIYQDYDVANGLGGVSVVDPPRARVPQRKPNYNNANNYNYNQPPRSSQNLIGKEACKSGAKTVGHESTCDLYYECYEGQGFITSCPNGLVYANDGRFGLIGVCDYPHNVPCLGRKERSKFVFFFSVLHAACVGVCAWSRSVVC